jgi:hypothetical protein
MNLGPPTLPRPIPGGTTTPANTQKSGNRFMLPWPQCSTKKRPFGQIWDKGTVRVGEKYCGAEPGVAQ